MSVGQLADGKLAGRLYQLARGVVISLGRSLHLVREIFCVLVSQKE